MPRIKIFASANLLLGWFGEVIDEGVSGLIRQIYRGAEDATAWDRALDRLLALTGSRFVMVSTVDVSDKAYNTSHFHGPDDGRFLDAIDDYRSHLFRDDPSLSFALRRPLAGSVRLRPLLDAQTAGDVERHYERWLRSEMRVGDSEVRYSPQAEGLVLGVSLHTACERDSHSPGERALFAMLFDHIDNALRLVARPPLIEGPDAIILVDRRGRVRDMSDAAAALVAGRDGLTIVGGRLQTARRADQSTLNALVARAVASVEQGSAGGGMAIVRPSGKRPLLVTARPLPSTQGLAHVLEAAALLRVVDPEQRMAPNPSWTAMFGLTPAETRLAVTLLNDDRSLREAAASLGIAYGTARTQLASIFDKTGVRTQSHLLRLLTMLSADR